MGVGLSEGAAVLQEGFKVLGKYFGPDIDPAVAFDKLGLTALATDMPPKVLDAVRHLNRSNNEERTEESVKTAIRRWLRWLQTGSATKAQNLSKLARLAARLYVFAVEGIEQVALAEDPAVWAAALRANQALQPKAVRQFVKDPTSSDALVAAIAASYLEQAMPTSKRAVELSDDDLVPGYPATALDNSDDDSDVAPPPKKQRKVDPKKPVIKRKPKKPLQDSSDEPLENSEEEEEAPQLPPKRPRAAGAKVKAPPLVASSDEEEKAPVAHKGKETVDKQPPPLVDLWSLADILRFEEAARVEVTSKNALALESNAFLALLNLAPGKLRARFDLPAKVTPEDAADNKDVYTARMVAMLRAVREAWVNHAKGLPAIKASALKNPAPKIGAEDILRSLATAKYLDQGDLETVEPLFAALDAAETDEAKQPILDQIAAAAYPLFRAYLMDPPTAAKAFESAVAFVTKHHKVEPNLSEVKALLGTVSFDATLVAAMGFTPSDKWAKARIKLGTWPRDVALFVATATAAYLAWTPEAEP